MISESVNLELCIILLKDILLINYN